jgi:hypothetical protein
VTTVELEPTAAYAHREYSWLPTVPGEGVLVIRQRKTAGGQEEADVYAVEEQTPEHSPQREFLLVNVTDDEQPQPYEVVTRGGDAISCTCKAAKCRVPVCKHRSSLQSILSQGDFT